MPTTELQACHTSCKDCVFATYQGITQVGCEFGRLDKFREQGVEIVQAHDEDLEFEIVNGRKCSAYRDKSGPWAADVAPMNRRAAVRQELVVRTDVVIPLEEDCEGLLEKLKASVLSAMSLALKPSSMHILNNQSRVRVGDIVALMRSVVGGLDYVWRVTDVKERRLDDSRVDLDRSVDNAVGLLKGHFYTILRPGQELPAFFTLDLDRAVVDELGRFVVMLPASEGGPGLTVALGFHRAPMVNGNKAIPACSIQEEDDEPAGDDTLLVNVVEKAKYLAKKLDLAHLVIPAKEVCSTLA